MKRKMNLPSIKQSNSVSKLLIEDLQELDRMTYMSAPDVREMYYYLNNGVGTVIQINRLPKVIGKRMLNVFKGYSDLLITIDMEHLDNKKMLDFLSKKMDGMENESTIIANTAEARDVGNKMEDEANFMNHIDHTYENGKYVTMRIYVQAKDLDDLQAKVDWIYSNMKSREMFGAIQRNLLDNDLKALSSCDNPVKEIATTRAIVNMMMSDNITEVKPYMIPLGDTETGLPYCPDFFSYSYRSYCVALMGVQGSGKSSLIKSIVQSALMRKEQVIILDVHNGEYAPLANRYHVPSISLNMRNSINPYQIFNNDLEEDVITEMVIADTVMLNRKIFMSVTGEENKAIISMYMNLITDMYKDYIGIDVDEVRNNEWFSASDIKKRLLKNIDESFYENAPSEFVFTLLSHLDMMINTYGYFFNCKTTIEIDIENSIRFDLSSLNIESGGQLENAYFGLIFSFLGKILRQNERLNEALEQGKKVERPIHPVSIVAEETGTILKNVETAKMFDIFMRQTRKSRTSFIFALHTMKDIIGGDEERKNVIESIFALCSTYILGQIDTSTADALPSFVSGMSRNDALSAVNFTVRNDDKEKRRKFLAYTVDDRKRIIFYSKVLPRQQALFGGGK